MTWRVGASCQDGEGGKGGAEPAGKEGAGDGVEEEEEEEGKGKGGKSTGER